VFGALRPYGSLAPFGSLGASPTPPAPALVAPPILSLPTAPAAAAFGAVDPSRAKILDPTPST